MSSAQLEFEEDDDGEAERMAEAAGVLAMLPACLASAALHRLCQYRHRAFFFKSKKYYPQRFEQNSRR